MDAIASDYDETSIVIINNQVFRGTTAIRNVLIQLFEVFDHGRNRIDTPIVDGRIIYITWHFTPDGKQEQFGTDTFLIEDGKITVQTIASPLYELFPIEAQIEEIK